VCELQVMATSRDPADIVRSFCEENRIPLAGVADCSRWHSPPFQPWMPDSFFPDTIYPEAHSVIVIGLPVPLPALETTPSIWYHDIYQTINTLLDGYTYTLAVNLSSAGAPSVSIPRDGYGSIDVLLEEPRAFFSHRHAAYLAGLGTFGMNNMLLTPAFGPRVRFGSVLTTAVLPPDPVMKEELCTQCMACVDSCPARAIPGGNYPGGMTDKVNCARYSQLLRSKYSAPCGVCIKVCPVGRDRVQFKREDPSLYTIPEDHPAYLRAWEHVQAVWGEEVRTRSGTLHPAEG